MRRGTVVFILFIIIAAAIIGVSQFLRSQPPMEVTVAADPLAEAWVNDAVAKLNATDPLVNSTRRVHFSVITISDSGVWQDDPGWTRDSHPAAWLPSSSVAVSYLPSNLVFRTVQDSTAQTVLVWGGYQSRVDILTQDGAALDWPTVEAAARQESWAALGGQSEWQFIKLAFSPASSMTGVGVLLSGAAAYNETFALDRAAVTSQGLYDWLQPVIDSVPNFQTLGNDPARAMARGPSTAEIALLPEAQWLLNMDALLSNETLRLNYPQYQFVFDFPLAMWDAPDSPLSADEQAAVVLLGQWLVSAQSQNAAPTFALRPVTRTVTEGDSLFGQALSYGIELAPDLSKAAQAPTRQATESLIAHFR